MRKRHGQIDGARERAEESGARLSSAHCHSWQAAEAPWSCECFTSFVPPSRLPHQAGLREEAKWTLTGGSCLDGVPVPAESGGKYIGAWAAQFCPHKMREESSSAWMVFVPTAQGLHRRTRQHLNHPLGPEQPRQGVSGLDMAYTVLRAGQNQHDNPSQESRRRLVREMPCESWGRSA